MYAIRHAWIKCMAVLLVLLVIMYSFVKICKKHSINVGISTKPSTTVEISKEPPIIARMDLQSFVVDSGHTKVKRQKLPKLEQMDWPEREYLPFPLGAPGILQVPMEPQFSREQMRTTWNLVSTFEDVMEELGLSDKWMIVAGSLVGCFRHHDITPWDDDLDVLIDYTARPALWKKMAELAPKIIIGQSGYRDKIWAELIEPSDTSLDIEGSRKLSKYSWGWPLVDISYYISNETHIQERASSDGRHVTYAKSDVFPQIFRPFYKHWVPTPRNAFSVIMQSKPGKEDCYTFGYSHPFEIGKTSRSVGCAELANRYAFVEHSPLSITDQDKNNNRSDLVWVRERLIRGGRSIHEVTLVAPRHVANVETYKMRLKA